MCSTAKGSITLKAPTLLPVGLSLDQQRLQANMRSSNENVERLQQQRLQEFENKQPEFHDELGLEHIRYPSHLVQFKQALKQLIPNQTLKIISSSSALIEDLAASCRILKLPAQALRYRRQHYLYVTRTDC